MKCGLTYDKKGRCLCGEPLKRSDLVTDDDLAELWEGQGKE